MRRLAKNLILATAAVSAIFLVDLSHVEAITQEKICPYQDSIQYLDFWSKFRDTVMPDPNEPQNNNPPKEIENEDRRPAEKPAPKPVKKTAPKPVK
jgi:hypothetical protein